MQRINNNIDQYINWNDPDSIENYCPYSKHSRRRHVLKRKLGGAPHLAVHAG